MKTLKNKKIVILGGSSGLGLATAKAASLEGAEVVIVSSNQQRIDVALKEISSVNSKGIVMSLDRDENIKQLFSKIGPFDHLVYTAAENLNLKKISETDLVESKDFFKLRFWGALSAVKYATPYIASGGSINLISGTANQRPGSGWALASSICGAVNGLTKALAVELAPIRVNAVSPGVIKTSLWDSIDEKEREEFYKLSKDSNLLNRVGEAKDVAETFLFLMKQLHVTGQIITIDAGSVLV